MITQHFVINVVINLVRMRSKEIISSKGINRDISSRHPEEMNSYVSTMAADGSIGSTRVFFTNKRFYAKENRFTLSRGLDTKNTIVELQEISGTQILHENPISYFIWGGLLLIFNLIIGAIAGGEALVGALISGLFYAGLFTLLYFLRRGTYLLISFAGETVKLRVKMYNYNSVVTFLRGLQSYIARLKK